MLNEKPLDGFSWSEGRLTRKQTTSRPDTLWPEIWTDMSDASKRKVKQKWTIEKPKLDNARKLRGIHFIDLDDGEFKDVMKNARGKLEVPMPAAIPFKVQRGKYREKLVALKRIARQNTLAFLRPMNPRGSACIMKIISQEKE